MRYLIECAVPEFIEPPTNNEIRHALSLIGLENIVVTRVNAEAMPIKESKVK